MEGIAAQEGIGDRIAPARCDGITDRRRESGEETGVAGKSELRRGVAAGRVGVGGAGLEEGDEVGGAQCADL